MKRVDRGRNVSNLGRMCWVILSLHTSRDRFLGKKTCGRFFSSSAQRPPRHSGNPNHRQHKCSPTRKDEEERDIDIGIVIDIEVNIFHVSSATVHRRSQGLFHRGTPRRIKHTYSSAMIAVVLIVRIRLSMLYRRANVVAGMESF